MKDLLIAGAGPTGLAAAIYAKKNGLDVVVTDYKKGVIDKACGEGLMPGGVRCLTSLGIDIDKKRNFAGIRYVSGNRHADGYFKNGQGWGIRRITLHNALREKAQSLGIDILEHRITHIDQHADHVTADKITARHLLACDGLNSSIRKILGIEVVTGKSHRMGLRQHFNVKPWSNFVEVHWSDIGEAYVTPISEDTVGIAILFDKKNYNLIRKHHKSEGFFDRILAYFPQLREKCQHPASQVRGAGPFYRKLSQIHKGRVLFAGDAAGYLDPITGEGIRLGFATAQAAVSSISNNTVSDYDKQWQSITRRYWWSTSTILALSQFGLTRQCMVPALQYTPGLFNSILANLESD